MALREAFGVTLRLRRVPGTAKADKSGIDLDMTDPVAQAGRIFQKILLSREKASGSFFWAGKIFRKIFPAWVSLA